MLQTALSGLVVTALASALAAQVPLSLDSHGRAQCHHPTLGNEDITDWSLDKPPNTNTTDHLVFETVHSLLQHWPNSLLKNGHNIVPGTIPKGTLLYHGTGHKSLPPGPEWVSLDPEHSYLFCHDASNNLEEECWHLTLATTRPLKVIYFDGGSAWKLPYGSMDTQDLLAWGRLGYGERPASDESLRIQDLCEWGKDFGLDGFVRMEIDFEVMLCDFTSGVSETSFVNLPSRWASRSMTRSILFEATHAGSWHSRFPGETRIQLDLPGLVSFYDTQLAPSLVATRAGQERWYHRVRDISSEDLSAAKSRLEATLRSENLSSGIDWKTLFQVIVDRYAQRLELTRYLLNSSATEPDEILDLVNKTQSLLRTMLTPYLILSVKPTDPSDKTALDWTIPVYKHCSTIHTCFMESTLDSETDAEKLLFRAIRGTSQEICRVVTRMWAAGVYAGIDPLLNTRESLDTAELTELWHTWSEDLDSLMTWLSWSVWVKCNPACGPMEMCYLHPWLVGFKIEETSSRDPLTRFNARTVDMEGTDPDQWLRPQPKCVRQTDPYDI